jgi:aspartate/methionine/tyrosine aminotransferase
MWDLRPGSIGRMLRKSLDTLPASRIREVANEGLGRADVLKFWFGEGDLPTPEFIRRAAIDALAAGETFYNHNLGQIELREAIAAYASRLHGTRVASDRIAVTSAGVNALALVSQALLEPGDRAVIVTPVWPNLTAQPRIMSAQVIEVPLQFSPRGWQLDLQRLLDAVTPATRMVLVNSPNNPTGWAMPQSDWDALLAHCRTLGVWLVSDDAYERLVFDDAEHAPGVIAAVDVHDRFISANTFSKAWSMTGWRLGWLLAPPAFIEQLGKLIEFNTSCAPPFVQRAGVAALRDGEAEVSALRRRLRASRDALIAGLRRECGIEVAVPPGAMYLFFQPPGVRGDSLGYCKRLVHEAGLGLAPGVAFGDVGEGFVRWCFATGVEAIEEGVRRLARAAS